MPMAPPVIAEASDRDKPCEVHNSLSQRQQGCSNLIVLSISVYHLSHQSSIIFLVLL